MIDLNDIQQAAARLQGHILHTPCVVSRTLSGISGAQVYLKFENLQFTASFKERGACNKLAQLPPETRGVVAMSAGNHAQGVAYHAQRLGLRAIIVMPRFTPGVKVERTRGFGAEVVLHGDTLDEARTHALALAEQKINLGKAVIIDASFKKRTERLKALALAKKLQIRFFVLECFCPDDITQKRLEKRVLDNDNVSDGRWELFQQQKDNFEPIDEITADCRFKIDTSEKPEVFRHEMIRKIKLAEFEMVK